VVAAGKVTADGFENLRALIAPLAPSLRGPDVMLVPRPAAAWDYFIWFVNRVENASTSTRNSSRTCLSRPLGRVLPHMLARETLARRLGAIMLVAPPPNRKRKALIRGGRFISGFVGEQFDGPEAVDLAPPSRRTIGSGEGSRSRCPIPLVISPASWSPARAPIALTQFPPAPRGVPGGGKTRASSVVAAKSINAQSGPPINADERE